MKLRPRLAIAFVCAVLSPAAFAQWAPYASLPVPKKADGSPDLDAPAPRTADGHPDFSGTWDRAGGGAGPVTGGPPGGGGPPPGVANGAAPRGGPRPAGAPPPGAGGPGGRRGGGPPPRALRAPDGTPYATFFNIGAGIPGGAPYRPLAAALRAERMSNNQKNNPDAHCLPMGLMQLHLHPQPRKVVQTPSLIVIMYEGNQGLRQIYLDGRPVPEVNDDLQPWWYGYSVGHWEGDTLVVETVGFRDDVWLDVQGSPLTNKGKMIERFTRPNFGTLQIDVTIDDPTAYTKPFTVRVLQHLAVDQELIEFICNENERSSQHYE